MYTYMSCSLPWLAMTSCLSFLLLHKDNYNQVNIHVHVCAEQSFSFLWGWGKGGLWRIQIYIHRYTNISGKKKTELLPCIHVHLHDIVCKIGSIVHTYVPQSPGQQPASTCTMQVSAQLFVLVQILYTSMDVDMKCGSPRIDYGFFVLYTPHNASYMFQNQK